MEFEPLARCGALMCVDENQQRDESLLMPSRAKELQTVAVRERPAGTHNLAEVGHANTEELVALTVIAWACLEEPRDTLGTLGVGKGANGGADVDE
jgi:hypothetical protein